MGAGNEGICMDPPAGAVLVYQPPSCCGNTPPEVCYTDKSVQDWYDVHFACTEAHGVLWKCINLYQDKCGLPWDPPDCADYVPPNSEDACTTTSPPNPAPYGPIPTTFPPVPPIPTLLPAASPSPAPTTPTPEPITATPEPTTPSPTTKSMKSKSSKSKKKTGKGKRNRRERHKEQDVGLVQGDDEGEDDYSEFYG